MHGNSESATLLIYCPDKIGILTAVTQLISSQAGNIIEVEEHVDTEYNIFFMRVQWQMSGFKLSKDEMKNQIKSLAEVYEMKWRIYFSGNKPKMALFVTKLSHCLFDILSRVSSGEWNVEIPLIISNHTFLEDIAKRFGIPFHHIPITKENKEEQEKKTLKILADDNVSFIVLARYMQIVSEQFISHYPNKIINIHHSFLPAFPGARPYHSAFERGVKIIGATSHYVTKDLDQGPIIEQDIIKVSHKDSVSRLVRKGQDLEKIVLSRAIRHHLERKVLAFNNKTIVFD